MPQQAHEPYAMQADTHVMDTGAAGRCRAVMQSEDPSSHGSVLVHLRDTMAGSSLTRNT